MTTIANLAATGRQAKRNSMSRHFGLTLRSAAALLALFTLAAPASALTVPFQQYQNGTCSGTLCRINFWKVQPGWRLEIENVSCYVRVKYGPNTFPIVRAAQMLVVGANLTTVLNAVTLAPASLGQNDTEKIYSANHAISAFASPGQRFQAYVEIDRGSFSQVACHISGERVKL